MDYTDPLDSPGYYQMGSALTVGSGAPELHKGYTLADLHKGYNLAAKGPERKETSIGLTKKILKPLLRKLGL